MSEISTFTRAVFNHWRTLMGGGTLIILLVGYEHYVGAGVSWIAYIVIAFITVVIACFLAWRDEHRKRIKAEAEECSDKWLHEIAEKDKREIEIAVSVVDCKVFDSRFDVDSPYITFQLTIFNGSVYPISIERKVDGFITYLQRRLTQDLTPAQEWKTKNIARGQAVRIWIRQWLDKKDVEFIEQIDPTYAYFSFEQLVINITGSDGFDDIKPTPLSFTLIKGVDIRKRM